VRRIGPGRPVRWPRNTPVRRLRRQIVDHPLGGRVDGFTAVAPHDRAGLLRDAADRLDRLAGHLGSGAPEPDRYGAMLREFAEDQAKFAVHPDMRPLPQVNAATETVAEFRLAGHFSFWWLRIPLLLFPRRDWAFTRLEVQVEFSPEEPKPELRPKAFDILPSRRFDAIFKVGAHARLSVGADGHFNVQTPDVAVPLGPGGELTAGAGARANASVGANVGIGPVEFRAVKARIEHTAPGLERVFWRLDGAQFFQENQPELVIVLQVPRGLEKVSVVGVLQAYRRFNLFPAKLQAMISQLPEALRAFFRNGAPLADQQSYDLVLPRNW
jgi:hypothetical protein